jgi:hypothetical protein
MRLDSLFLVFVFVTSFGELSTAAFNYFFVLSGLVFVLVHFDKLVVPFGLRMVLGFLLMIPLLQYFATGNYAAQWIFNYAWFWIGMVSVVTVISHMRAVSMYKLGVYLRCSVFVLMSVYVLYPVLVHGVFDGFLIDRNYLYATANSLLPPDVLVKQKMSALVTFYVVIIWEMIRGSNRFPRILLLLVLLVLALNMLVGSRSQAIGLLMALILVTAGNGVRRIKIYAATVAFSFAAALWFMTTDFFKQLSAFDIRVMLFHSAAVSFFENIFVGIGLFFTPQFLEVHNDRYFSDFAFLYPESFKGLIDFPTGFESSFMQFSLELGLLSVVLLYFSVRFLLNIYSSSASGQKFFVFFVIAYLFSSVFEDNLTQPSFYVMVSILIGLRAFDRRRADSGGNAGHVIPVYNDRVGLVR